jgi:acyl-CoA thioesterase
VSPGPTKFSADTAVERDPSRTGRYLAELPPDWNAPLNPQGGVSSVVALRAMMAELDHPDQTLRSCTTVFAGQVPAGPLEVDVSVLRRGRTMSQASATVRAAGADHGHTVVASFGQPRAGFWYTDVEPPNVDPPAECPSFRDPPPEGFERRGPDFTFWDQVEGRAALGHPPWEPYEPVSSDRAHWSRFDEPPFLDDGSIDPLALVVLADAMPGAAFERIGAKAADLFVMVPSVDLTVHVLGEPRSEWILCHTRSRHASEGYASMENTMWDPEVGIVAYATQVMLFSFPEGAPPDHVLRVD